MSKHKKSYKKTIGIACASLGLGFILTIIIPVWGWIIAIGGALIYIGWQMINQCRHK
ncbi:MAG: hypothetical protein Q8900_03710 [Bacillota bacterium]|nr:hypothetical protein [Bacillota bacterium]